MMWRVCGALLLCWATLGCEASSSGVPAASPVAQSASDLDGPSGARAQPDASLQQGNEAYARGDLQGALQLLQRAAERQPTSCEIQHALAVVRARLGQQTAALQALRAASAKTLCDAAVLAQTDLMLELGQGGAAERWLQGLRARNANSATVLTALAEVNSVNLRSEEAQSLAREALKLDPGFAPAMLLIARDHYRARRWDLALYTLSAILDGFGAENPPRDPDNAQAQLLRGLILKEQNQRQAALTAFQRALQLRPDLLQARLNLAVYMLEAGNALEAAPLLEAGLGFDNDDLLLHLNLGDAYRLLGRPEEAIKQLQWVTQVSPNLPQAHYDLGLVYLFSEQIPGQTPQQALQLAIQHFERYKQLRPRSKSGPGDDVEDLIGRARNKQAVLQAMQAPAASGGERNSAPEQQKAVQ